jgi:ferredoxin/flavodoxin---NADP+ reductase
MALFTASPAPALSLLSESTDKFTRETITWIHPWTTKLFSFRITRPKGYRFAAGQWARLGVLKTGCQTPVWRAYSLVNAPYEPYLEFYSIVVPGGEFTPELANLAVGDAVFLEKMPYGFLTMARFAQPPTADAHDLWLLSTGTGLAPFLSVLGDLSVWEHYRRIVLVHGVRHRDELAYAQTIEAFRTHPYFAEFFIDNPQQLVYQPCLTREPNLANVAASTSALPALAGRIPALIQSGKLEAAVGITLDTQRSHVMICGNPDMVHDTRTVLKMQGMTVSRNAQLGNMAVENYW